MLDRRNHVFEQLGRVFRERSAAVVDEALPAQMLSLVLKLANAEPRPALNAPSAPLLHNDSLLCGHAVE
jgi:hypothetical protein